MEGEGMNGLIPGVQNQNRGQQQLQPPRRCPRCTSTNTKFCYFNNYNQSQPRYLCKACRRYWTQGGTLRNVPFGGGCRRGRRARVAASTQGVRSLPPMPIAPALQHLAPALMQLGQLQPRVTSTPPNVVPSNRVFGVRGSGSMVPTFSVPPMMTPYCHGPAVDDGGYLSSLLSNNKSLDMAAGTSNFSAMPGAVNVNPFTYQQQQRQIQPPPLYQMSNWERSISDMYNQGQPGLTLSGMSAGGSSAQPSWSDQNFMNDANPTGSFSDVSVPNSVKEAFMNEDPYGSGAAGSSSVPFFWPKISECDPSP